MNKNLSYKLKVFLFLETQIIGVIEDRIIVRIVILFFEVIDSRSSASEGFVVSDFLNTIQSECDTLVGYLIE